MYPCVEDPEKLTYLDLESCFGDLCDLTNCAYLKQVGAISNTDPQDALDKVLMERWAYDDLSEDESGNELASSSCMDVTEDCPTSNSHQSAPTKTSHESVADPLEEREANIDKGIKDPIDEETHEGMVMDQTEGYHDHVKRDLDLTGPPLRENDFDVIYFDSQVANEETVDYYVQMACNGEPLRLKSVDGEPTEFIL
jgi:hypothetical protein